MKRFCSWSIAAAYRFTWFAVLRDFLEKKKRKKMVASHD
jgi:uncharacterized membrane protein